jgi:hypothetical protein
MPTLPENRRYYGHRWRTKTRIRILKRAGGNFYKKGKRKGQYAGGARCEFCGALDRSRVIYLESHPAYYFELSDQLPLFSERPLHRCFRRDDGKPVPKYDDVDLTGFIERHVLRKRLKELRAERDATKTLADQLNVELRIAALKAKPVMVRVQIGVCHLNHTPGDDRDDNLRAGCRRCHLHHDEKQHRKTRAIHKDTRRPLLTAIARAGVKVPRRRSTA